MKLPNNIFNRPTTNIELQDIANRLGIPLNGILMKDELNTKNVKDGCYIINLESSDMNGSHWLGLFKNKQKYYYCDSFGMPPPQTLIDNLRINPNNLFFNERQIQDIKSKRCGFYSLYFLYCMQNKNINECLKQYVNTFSEDTDENEKIIKSIFLKL